MKSLTLAYITSRREPKIEWLAQSLTRQLGDRKVSIIVVDAYADQPFRKPDLCVTFFEAGFRGPCKHVLPKPTIWQGSHRITKEDWWAKSNALNTAICLCETEWIAFVDDRSVLAPGWLERVDAAMAGNYPVCGTFEKWAKLEVHYTAGTGIPIIIGELLGGDDRIQRYGMEPSETHNWFGGSWALPTEVCLQVNGFSEDYCDGLSFEDMVFGHNLRCSGITFKFDGRMKIIEDRTPGQIDGALKRADKGGSPNDKSHAIFNKFVNEPTSCNSYDIARLRLKVLAGEPFPPPTASHLDWFDGAQIKDME